MYISEKEFKILIKTLPDESISADDYINPETGEIYLEKGKPAKTGQFSPYREKKEREKTVFNRRLFENPEELFEEILEKFLNELEISNLFDSEEISEIIDVTSDLADDFFFFEPRADEIALYLDLEVEELKEIIADRIAALLS